MYLRSADDRTVVRDAVQHANDCTFCNPAPNSDDAAKERWASRWLKHYEQKLAELRKRPPAPSWPERMAREVAPSVSGYTIVTRDNSGVVRIGKSYTDRRIAFTQRTRLDNVTAISVYVAVRDGNRVKVYSGIETRLIAVDLAEDSGR